MKHRRRRAFTLVEILVVIAIVLLASLMALPVMNALGGRQVTDAARIFSGSLVGIRDSAVRYNEPRGIRLLPDPVLTIPAPGLPGAGTIQLAYNRMIPIELAGDYSQGKVTIGPQLQPTDARTGFPPVCAYPDLDFGGAFQYPFPDSSLTPKVLMIEECPYEGGYVTAFGVPNAPTNWYWTIRVGDKIKLNGTGRAYTIVGPCTINPWASTASGNQGNPELFVNVGAPGTSPPLVRDYYEPDPTVTDPLLPPIKKFARQAPEFLFVVNGEDDDNDGLIDEGFDGLNNNPVETIPTGQPDRTLASDNDYIDDLIEWEPETWKGTAGAVVLADSPKTDDVTSPSPAWAIKHYQNGYQNFEYTIERRPTPSPGAREVMLPAGMVIDATTWESSRERSRIPVQLGSLYCDVMVNPAGTYVPTTQYSTPSSADPLPFLHFWITDRGDLHPRGVLWGLDANGVPNHNASDPSKVAGAPYVYYQLPMTTTAMGSVSGVVTAPTADGQYYPPASLKLVPALKADRRLVTMFNQSGLITTNTIEPVPPVADVFLPGEGFNVSDVNYPFLKAQQGLREAR